MNKSVPIRFRTAEEFKIRLPWRDGLDPSQHTLKEIIGDYSFSKKDALACGLKNCRTIHQKGYVVATVDELETHIGNRCGTRYFGVNWGSLSSVYDQAVEARDIEEWLQSVLGQRETLLARARHLLEALYGENEKIRDIRDRLSKDGVVLNAFERAARVGGAIQVELEVDEETANARGLQESQRRYFETVGRIFGIETAVPAKGTLRLAGSAMADQLRELRRNGPDALPAYVRNVRLRLFSEAHKAIVEVQP